MPGTRNQINTEASDEHGEEETLPAVVCVDLNLSERPHAHYLPEEHLSEAEYKRGSPALSGVAASGGHQVLYPTIDPQLDEAYLVELGCLSSPPSSPNSPMTQPELNLSAAKGTSRYRRLCIWNTLTNPSFSPLARSYSYYLDVLVVVSTILLLVESVPEWNAGVWRYIWLGLESFITGHFLVDWVGKLLTAPQFNDYFLSSGCLLDALSIVPWVTQVVWILTDAHPKGWTILRLVRLLRFGRFFQAALTGIPEMRLFWKAVQRSRLAVLFLVCYLFGAGIFFSCCLFLAETASCQLDPVTHLWMEDGKTVCAIQNMFDALWLTIVTMTTVGYGDVTPKTAAGKTVATCIMIASMVFLALPVSIFGANLTELYLENRLAKKILRRKRQRPAQDEHEELLEDDDHIQHEQQQLPVTPPEPQPELQPTFASPLPPRSKPYQHSIVSQTSLHSPSSMMEQTTSLTQVSCPPFFSMRHTVNIYAILEAMEITMEEISNDIVLSRRRLDLIERQHRQLEALILGHHIEFDHHLQQQQMRKEEGSPLSESHTL